MKFLLALVCMLALATASPSDSLFNAMKTEQLQKVAAEHITAFHSIRDQIMSIQPHLIYKQAGKMSTASFHTTVSSECQTTYNTLQSKVDNCKEIQTAMSSVTQTSFAAACSSQCGADVISYFDTVKSTCSGELASDSVFRAQYYDMQRSVKAFCVKDGETFCLPEFMKVAMTFSGGMVNGNFNDTVLDNMCTTCTSKIMAIYAESNNGVDSDYLTQSFKLICIKDQGKYCYPQIYSKFYNANPSTGDYYALFCTPCFRKFAYAVPGSAGSSQKAAIAALGAFCVKGDDGKYCLEKFTSFQTSGGFAPSCTAAIQQGQMPCSNGECAAAQRKFVTDLGCCFATLLQVGMAYAGEDAKMPTDEQFEQAFCTSMPSACTGTTKVVKLVLKLKNLSWSWYSASAANKKKADDAITADLAELAGVSPTAVTLVASETSSTSSSSLRFRTLAGSGVQYDTAIKVDTDEQGTYVASDVKSQADAGTLVLSTVSTLPSDAKVNAAEGFTVSGVTVTEEGGAANTLSVSIFAIVSVFITAMMLRQ